MRFGSLNNYGMDMIRIEKKTKTKKFMENYKLTPVKIYLFCFPFRLFRSFLGRTACIDSSEGEPMKKGLELCRPRPRNASLH